MQKAIDPVNIGYDNYNENDGEFQNLKNKYKVK